MLDQIDLLESERVVAWLVPPGKFVYHRNQVACVTDQRLVFLRKKTLGSYYAIEYVPLYACTEIRYRKTFAAGPALFGAFLAILGLGLLLLTLFGDVFMIRGVLCGFVLISMGAGFVLGVKRHALRFRCGDRNLEWISSKGEFARLRPQMEDLRSLAYSRGIVIQDFLL